MEKGLVLLDSEAEHQEVTENRRGTYILMERIRDKEHQETYDDMVRKRQTESARIRHQINGYSDAEQTLKKKRAEIKHNLSILDDIISSGSISNTHIRMLVNRVIVTERNKELNIEIILNAPFQSHLDEYDGIENLIGKWADEETIQDKELSL